MASDAAAARKEAEGSDQAVPDRYAPYRALYDRPLTDAECEEMATNLVEFFKLLLELDRQQRQDAEAKALEQLSSDAQVAGGESSG